MSVSNDFIYLAKSKPDVTSGRLVTVSAHCRAVACLARQYGDAIGLGSLSEAAGLCHDYGKYGSMFQDVIAGKMHGVDHAIPGAAMAGQFSERVAEAVAGHHAGLFDYSELKNLFRDVVDGSDCLLPSGKRPSLLGKEEFKTAQAQFFRDNPGFKQIAGLARQQESGFNLGSGIKWKDALYRMFLERFLFSCLVDADYTSSCHEETGDMPEERDIQRHVDACFDRLDVVRNNIISESKANDSINDLRDRVYASCSVFDHSKRFYLLSAPTGSGKSLAMMRFALEQCRSHDDINRVIFVLPFLTLTDQTAKLARDIFDDVLVDTSTEKDREDMRYMTETWNSECIVTTMVQFFQSLFSDKPGDCRKLHRIAHSVIVFDELQALPTELSRVCLQSLHWLCERFHCRILISTATPPQYSLISELDFDPEILFDRHMTGGFNLTRSGFDVMSDPIGLDAVAEMALKYDNSCVIVNLRAHARQIYKYWSDNHADDIYFITTDLCPDHRRAIIDTISSRQKNRQPVHVVSTQCIEAGVDLDFKRIFRAWAPLPSLVQSAGRQDRNGFYGSSGMVVFLPDDPDRRDSKLYPSSRYCRDTTVTRRFADDMGWDAFHGYYRQLFSNFSEPDKLSSALCVRDYSLFSKASRLIRSGGRQVAVPYGPVYYRLLEAFYGNIVTRKDLSDASGILVSTYARDNFDMNCSELVIYRRGIEMHTGIYILTSKDCYDGHTGLDLSKACVSMV